VLERIPENPLDENALMLLRVAPTSPISDYSMLDYCAATARAQREHQQQREGEGGETGSDDVTLQAERLSNQWDSFYGSKNVWLES